MQIILRDFNKTSDTDIIFSTMPKGVYYSAYNPIPRKYRNQFFKEIYTYLKILMDISNIQIACAKDDPNLVIGYSIHLARTIEWVFVKPAYRRQGIAKMLLKSNPLSNSPEYMDFNPDNLTKIGFSILKKITKKKYKKEEHEQHLQPEPKETH